MEPLIHSRVQLLRPYISGETVLPLHALLGNTVYRMFDCQYSFSNVKNERSEYKYCLFVTKKYMCYHLKISM